MPAVSVSAVTSTQIVAADYDRSILVITNTDGSANLHINFGATASTNESYIPPGGNMTISVPDNRVKCAVNGLSSSGTITAKYSKFSPGS